MIRRIADYSGNAGWTELNFLSTIGAFLIAASVLPFLWNVFITLRRPVDADGDPWDGYSLEWATISPPPPWNFDALPPVRSERPFFDLKHGAVRRTPSRCRPARARLTARCASMRPRSASASRSRATRTRAADRAASLRRSRPWHRMRPARPRTPMRSRDRRDEHASRVALPIDEADAELALGHAKGGGMDTALLGMMLFIASEVMFFAALFAAYFNTKATLPVFPPEGTEFLDPIGLPLFVTILLVASSFTMQWATGRIRAGDRTGLNRGIAITLALGVIFLFLQLYDYYVLITHDDFAISSGVYGTLFFTMTGFHGAHVLGGVIGLARAARARDCRGSSRGGTTSRSRPSTTTGTSSTSSGSCCS